MRLELTRRDTLLGIAAACATACASRAEPAAPRPYPPSFSAANAVDAIADVQRRVGGRIGVFALDTGTGDVVAHREDEHFAMCSTFKWVLGAAVLGRVDRRELALDARVPFGRADLLEHAPTTRAHVAEGALSVAELAQAAITNSDNTAANLLLARIDGPTGLTQFARRLGDAVTRFDRIEPALNANTRGDLRDTTTPRAMAGLLRSILCGPALARASRDRLIAWLRACETGHERLRAGLPAAWNAGDKTGTGDHGAVNDVAVAFPPGRSPVVIASYMTDSEAPVARLSAAHAEIGRIVAVRLGAGRS
jgi:beta-lactamase class A